MRRATVLLCAKSAILVLAGASLTTCNGGVQSITGTRPPPAIAVVPTTAVVHAGATIELTASVANAIGNVRETWMVTCAAAPCGTISPDTTASGTPLTYTAPATLSSSAGTITVTATALGDASLSASATLIPIGQIPGYDVGVDYHAYGADFSNTAFLTIYHQPDVRRTVQAQLQGMADRGATFIHTTIWFVTSPGETNFGETWRATFPMSGQEAANLRAYAQDAAAIQGAGGNRLRLDIDFEWLGAADYTIGSPSTGLGYGNLSAAEYTSRLEATTDSVLAAVSDVTRPDGVRLVDTIFLVGEVLIPGPGETGGLANEPWFLLMHYPRFVSVVAQHGLRPAVYFQPDGDQSAVLDNSYVDALYPILSGHRSMFWVYRGLKFMVDNGLPLPARIDFACYMQSTGATYDQLLQRILDDADATLPSLGAPKVYGAAETYYLTDPTLRLQYGQAFPAQAALNARLKRVSFWTTPDAQGLPHAAYPFTLEDFLPPPSP